MIYNFQPGDEVITIRGERGTITSVCTCEKCLQRGWPEPEWFNIDAGTVDHITDYDMKTGFRNFYNIGEHRFSDFDRASVLKELICCKVRIDELETQLRNMEEVIGEVS